MTGDYISVVAAAICTVIAAVAAAVVAIIKALRSKDSETYDDDNQRDKNSKKGD